MFQCKYCVVTTFITLKYIIFKQRKKFDFRTQAKRIFSFYAFFYCRPLLPLMFLIIQSYTMYTIATARATLGIN